MTLFYIKSFKLLTVWNSGGRGVVVGVSVMSSSGAVMRKKSMCLGLEGWESELQKERDSSTSCCQILSCLCRASSGKKRAQSTFFFLKTPICFFKSNDGAFNLWGKFSQKLINSVKNSQNAVHTWWHLAQMVHLSAKWTNKGTFKRQ